MTALLDLFEARALAAGGDVGAVVLDADGREVLAREADRPFFSASVIKLPLVMTLYEDAAEGRISLDERVAVEPRVLGSGVLRDLRDVEALTLRDLSALAMTVSDNTATNRIIERVGIGRVNARLDAWGCPTTRLRRAMFDSEAKARGFENLMTPREAASLLRRVVTEAAAREGPSAHVLRLLERNTNALRLGRYLPKGATLAHKDGWLDGPEIVENDVGIVRTAKPIVVAGFTRRVPILVARPLLGVLGLAAAELAGATINGLPLEVVPDA